MVSTAAEAIRNAHAWFEVNSGWAPPDHDTLREWVADGGEPARGSLRGVRTDEVK